MAALQFNAIEPALCTVLSNSDIAGNDVVNIALSDRFWHFAKEWVGNCAWCPHGKTAVHAAGLTTVVIDLSKNGRAMLMYCRRDIAIARYDITMKAVDEFFVWPVGGVR